MTGPAIEVGPAADAVRRRVAGLSGVALDDLVDRAGLQQRVDTKFIVYPAVLDRLLDRVDGGLDVLEIDGRRQFRYSSTYLDTPTWRTYRDHVQGRRRRFKARTRHYVDTGTCMFEVKLEGTGGSTEKFRIPVPSELAGTLTGRARRHLDRVLDTAGIAAPGDLEPSLRTDYLRTTLAHPHREVRLTIDTSLTCVGARGRVRVLRDRALLEVKTPTARDPVLRDLVRLGVRPVSVSKYCVGVALLNPQVPRHPWARVLRDHFGTSG